MTSNGTGMGHLSRMLSIALAAGDTVDGTMLSLSVAFPVVSGHGLTGEYCPSPERDYMPRHLWQGYLRRRLVALAREVDAEVFAFDGVVPYPGLVAALADLGDLPAVWVRRGMWRRGGADRALGLSGQFDLVIEPGELAAPADQGPTAQRTDAVRVPPVSLVDVVDRLDRVTAAAELGLDPDRPAALVTLGIGAVGDVVTPGAGAVRALLEEPGWQVCVTRAGTVGEGPVPDPRVKPLVGVYPLARYLGAFDVAVSAAGYNSVHELIPTGLPTLLLPNRDTKTDDQVARATWLADAGLVLTARPDDAAEVAAAVRRLTTGPVRTDLAAAVAALPRAALGGGAAAAARLLVRAVDDGAGTRTVAARTQLLGTLARDRAKRVIGHRTGEGARRVLGRPLTGGPARRLPVAITDGASLPPIGVRRLVVSDAVSPEEIASGPVVEHLLPGSSQRYRAERRAIVDDFYRVVPA
jgi:UDP:flavonoid glycosyltransferase YjiC (YdhE family)